MISVITRTKDRKIFLQRVFSSLIEQTYRPIEWIVVNDAGEDIGSIIDEFKKYETDEFTIKYICKKNSSTMEAATNVGLQNANGKYINILDDDDTIEKDFYHDAISYLDKESFPSIRGVISYSRYIYEDIDSEENIIFVKEEGFPSKPLSITLPAMLQLNQFPIHSFVYYRDVVKELGLYNESLPVLGDWEFNIRFLEKFDIGVIPKVYVNYHKRVHSKYANTVTDRIDEHYKYEALIRNKMLRSYQNNPAIALFMSQSTNTKELSKELATIRNISKSLSEQKNLEIKKRDEVIADKNERLKQRDEVIADKNERLKQRDEVIADKNERLKQRDEVIADKKNIIDVRNSELKNTNALLQEANKSLQEKKKLAHLLYKKEQEIKRLNTLAHSLRIKNRLKRVLHINPDSIIYKTAKSLKNSGFKSTIIKIKEKLIEENNVMPPVPNDIKPKKNTMKCLDEIKQAVESKHLPTLSNQQLVSILVLTRDGLVHIKRLFESIDENTIYENFEIIVVDNASSDETVTYLEQNIYNFDLKIIKNSQNESFSYANNQAAKKAKGKYLLLLNNDVEPLKGWLTHLVHLLESDDTIGSVGSKLIYPHKEKFQYSCGVQHAGIAFRYEGSFIRPYNIGTGQDPLTNFMENSSHAAVTAACLLISKETYFEVGGLDECYEYGYEDVDLGLKLLSTGYKNILSVDSTLFHYEFGTQNRDSNESKRVRRLKNMKIFQTKWSYFIKKRYWAEKLHSKKNVITEKKMHIALAVTDAGENISAGDYFTAKELAQEFEALGWNVSYLRRKYNEWYSFSSDIDIVITLLDAYDTSKMPKQAKKVITVAWARNWFDRWTKNPSFNNYDFVYASSEIACEYIAKNTQKKAVLMPIATNPSKFNPKNRKEIAKYKCDYCFTGSYWDVPRDIIDHINPSLLKEYTFHIYGLNWDRVEKLKPYNCGFLSYNEMPQVYANTKIVIDDANHVTKPYGSVNSRVFDALAIGTLVITNGVLGSELTFDGLLPHFDSQKELYDHLNFYLSNEDARLQKVAQLREMVLAKHTYQHRALKIQENLSSFYQKKSIVIKVPAPNWEEAKNWGDYHLALGLKKQLEFLGYNCLLQVLNEWDNEEGDAYDIVLVLRGLSIYKTKPHQLNIMWNISHPEKVSIQEYNSYNIILVASDIWAENLKSSLDVQVNVMYQCTDTEIFQPCSDKAYEEQLLFVGNSRKVFRKSLQYLLPTEYNLAVYGTLWEKIIDKKYIYGQHIENNEVYKYYSNAEIVLNDHWETMQEYGFISNRLFDVLACNGFILTDNVSGMQKLFGDAVVTYTSKEDLNEKVDYYLAHPQERKNLCQKGRELVLSQHTYKNRAKQIVKVINKFTQ